MNWLTYQKLNEEQRKEYDYKFSNPPQLNIISLVMITSIFMLSMTSFMFTAIFMMIQEGASGEQTDNVQLILGTSGKIIVLVAPLIIFGLVIDIVKKIIFVYRKRMWLNKQGIKYKYWWTTWFK